MISLTSEYALRAVVHLASIGGGPASSDEIAQATSMPKGYLSRILRALSKVGILTAQRGAGGGFALAKPAGKITVWEVLEASESGIKRIEKCPLHLGSHETSLCSLHALLDHAILQIETIFRDASIQDILTASTETVPLCRPLVETALTVKRKKD